MRIFPSIRIEGGLFAPDIFDQIIEGELHGQRPADFGIDGKRSLTDEIAATFADARDFWRAFKRRLERLPDQDPGTTLTRDVWVIPLLILLGYELSYNSKAYDVDEQIFPISHRAGKAEDSPPLHIVSFRQDLDKLAPTGRPRRAPHSLMQEFLNRTEHLWGIVTNGYTVRLLRDSTYIRRLAYLEFDLQAILEEQRFEDFAIFYRLLHRTRLPRTLAEAHECLLEQYFRHSVEQGGRVRDRLRDGVEQCIKLLANGFLSHPSNQNLRSRIPNKRRHEDQEKAQASSSCDSLPPEELYRQLLRLVYRFLFLLVSEDRGLVSSSHLYSEHYGVARLRRLVDSRNAYNDYDDIWQSMRVLWKVVSDEKLAPLLGVSPLNGELFAKLDLDDCLITNHDLLNALWHLIYYEDNRTLRRVNYAALDTEELGSVYESLLDYHPTIDWDSYSQPRFELRPGTERKSTGSYYTPPELVAELIRSALDPVIEERLKEAKRMANGEWRMANGEWQMVVEKVKQRFEHEVFRRLSGPRGVAKGHPSDQRSLPSDRGISTSGTLRTDEPDPPSGDIHSGEYSGGMGTLHGGIHSVPSSGEWQQDGARNTSYPERGDQPHLQASGATDSGGTPGHRQADQYPRTQPPTEKELAVAWKNTPLAIRHSLFAEEFLLSIRVCDPACGSGHFLLAAARRLGKKLASIRTGGDEPAPKSVREAIRDVVAQCIYGVDKNPLAVELCRVALWLEAHCEGKPLTFLDHRIRCGDSLVGVLDLKVLKEGIPDQAFEPVSGDDKTIARALKRRNASEKVSRTLPLFEKVQLGSSLEKIRPILEIPDDTPDQIRLKAKAHKEWQQETSHLRKACDLWTAAFFQQFKNESKSKQGNSQAELEKVFITTDILDRYLETKTAHGQVLGYAEELASHHRFFHWALEFPEVFQRGGFDLVLGNPPFMGGWKISGNLGDKYRHWLEIAYKPYGGNADLCAAFYRRVYRLLKPGGRMGMVATNTIGQGDTRESGLAIILGEGGAITFGKRFVKWTGAANVEVNLVGIYKPDRSKPSIALEPILDCHRVSFISSRLDAEPEAEPLRLKQNEGKAFIGDSVRGIGFVLEPEEAEALIAKDSRNADCLFPYLNGEDLNSHPEQQPSRWVICFHDWDLERARQYPDLLRIVEERVRPERERLTGPGDKRNREYWWQFGAYRRGMRQAIAPLRRVLVRAEVGEMHEMVFVRKGWIYSHMLIVFAFDDDYHFTLLQSSVHEVWVWRNASTLESRNRYTATDCFDTFPFPPLEYEQMANGEWQLEVMPQAFQQAAQVGAQYHEHRRQIMVTRWIGLTKTYNLFHNPACDDADIVRLRELHAEMDRAILACYGWNDIDLQHGFYQNERGQTRYTISPATRRQLLARLLELNLTLSKGK